MRTWRNISWAPCRQSFCYADTPGMGVEVCARRTPGWGRIQGGGVGLSDIEMYSTGVKSLQTHMTDINFHHLPCLLHRKNRFPLSGLNT